MKDEFYSLNTWQKQWNKVEKLLRTPEFKSVVVNELNSIRMIVAYNDLINYISKLELGILALLWCQGT